jgi:hypothetical protein
LLKLKLLWAGCCWLVVGGLLLLEVLRGTFGAAQLPASASR